MKKILFSALLCLVGAVAMAQPRMTYAEKVVYEGEDVTFRQIDAHTWEGNGKMMANETLYIVEGEERALLIDAGTNIKDLDKIVAGITSKPVTLIATHVHPDHTGAPVNYFKELYINCAFSERFFATKGCGGNIFRALHSAFNFKGTNT